MIAFSSVRFLLGPIILGLAVLMLAPCAVAWYIDSPDLKPFLISEAATIAAALILTLSKHRQSSTLRVREMFLLTSLSWVTVSTFGALPFMFSHTVGSFTDAVFESVSGVTTTGATVLTGLDSLPKDILLWRSMMQWIGGLGIIALGVAVLPFLRIGGMRLFQTESSDLSEKALPHTGRILNQLLLVYVGISAACAICYWLAGMDAFDAINHAMTTVSTGGFSTHDISIAYFESASVEFVAVVFMLLAAIPFMLYLPIILGRPTGLLRDGQVHSMLGIYLFVIVVLVAWLALTEQVSVFGAVREAAFNVISIATTTGYVSADYTTWGSFAIVVFFFLTFIGGCSGSTSGGIKIFRFKIAFVMFRETIQRLLHPSATFARSMQGRPLTDEIVASVMAFSLAFAATVGITATLLAVAGNDFVTSFSAAATATANVGPGIGDQIGPTFNFASLTQPSKWIICIAMLCGRLEIFTVVILLTPAFWRD
jgi:trk system potassium uptake protein TrkH